jgi:hypothetical protein
MTGEHMTPDRLGEKGRIMEAQGQTEVSPCAQSEQRVRRGQHVLDEQHPPPKERVIPERPERHVDLERVIPEKYVEMEPSIDPDQSDITPNHHVHNELRLEEEHEAPMKGREP